MNPHPKAANRYAQALLSLALESGAEPRVSDDLAIISRALAQSPELAAFAGDSLLPKASRLNALEALFMERVHPITWKFLHVLESKRRLGLLAPICSAFKEINNARQGIAYGEFSSPVPAPAATVTAMANRFGALFKKTVVLQTREAPPLLGGCRVQVGDIVYDFSLAARLRLAQHALNGA